MWGERESIDSLIKGCDGDGSMASPESICLQFVTCSHCCNFLLPTRGTRITPAPGHRDGQTSSGRSGMTGGTDAGLADLPGTDESVNVVDLSSLPRELVIIGIGVEVAAKTAHLRLQLGGDGDAEVLSAVPNYFDAQMSANVDQGFGGEHGQDAQSDERDDRGLAADPNVPALLRPAQSDFCLINFHDDRHDPFADCPSLPRLVRRDFMNLVGKVDRETFATTVTSHDVVADTVERAGLSIEARQRERLPTRETAFTIVLDAGRTAVSRQMHQARVVGAFEGRVASLKLTGHIASRTGAFVTGAILPCLA